MQFYGYAHMRTLFAVYNLKSDQGNTDYDDYLTKTKIPGIRGAPWCTAFNTWKIDKVLAPVHPPKSSIFNLQFHPFLTPRVQGKFYIFSSFYTKVSGGCPVFWPPGPCCGWLPSGHSGSPLFPPWPVPL